MQRISHPFRRSSQEDQSSDSSGEEDDAETDSLEGPSECCKLNCCRKHFSNLLALRGLPLRNHSAGTPGAQEESLRWLVVHLESNYDEEIGKFHYRAAGKPVCFRAFQYLYGISSTKIRHAKQIILEHKSACHTVTDCAI
jgi:hypothetical protein